MIGLQRFTCSILTGALVSLTAAFSASAADQAAVEAVQSGQDCPGCNLAGAELAGLYGDNRDFSFADISSAVLYRVLLPNANFAGAILTDAAMQRSDLSGANFQGAMLAGVNLEGADLSGATMDGALTDEFTHTDVTTTCPDGSAGPCEF